MAQPTQVLPSWLTASTSIFTVGGVATTSTTVLQLPLTYYGPSVSAISFQLALWSGKLYYPFRTSILAKYGCEPYVEHSRSLVTFYSIPASADLISLPNQWRGVGTSFIRCDDTPPPL